MITEENFAAKLFCDASGPNATYYNLANDNVAALNAALTRLSLQAALTRLLKRTDERGNPITVTAVELVVGPGLMLTAQEIVNATEYRAVSSNGDVTIISGNGIAANLTVSVNYQLTAVATTANADTSWWLFANPNGPRPAMEMGFLRGPRPVREDPGHAPVRRGRGGDVVVRPRRRREEGPARARRVLRGHPHEYRQQG